MRNLLDLVARSRNPNTTFFFCSSLASVLGETDPPDDTILEEPTLDPSTASHVGYSQSKWVTERVCHAAATSTGPLRGRVSVLRVGQLCGDTQTGYWNEKEGWPLLIRTAQSTGCLPLLDEVRLRLESGTMLKLTAGAVLAAGRSGCEHHVSDSAQTRPAAI
jgi:thioester reductase-like protein